MDFLPKIFLTFPNHGLIFLIIKLIFSSSLASESNYSLLVDYDLYLSTYLGLT